MGKPKTVITENGAVYQLSDPSALRLVYRIVGVALILMGAVPKKIQPAKKFLRFTGTPCAGNCTFGHWDPKVHTGQAQLERFEKAVHQPMAILSYNAQNGFAEIKGSGSDTYMTSLDECTCPDFDKRSKPCKHIYFLALQMGYTSDDFYSC